MQDQQLASLAQHLFWNLPRYGTQANKNPHLKIHFDIVDGGIEAADNGADKDTIKGCNAVAHQLPRLKAQDL